MQASSILKTLGHRGVVRLLNTANQAMQGAVMLFVQRLLNALSGMDYKTEGKKADGELCESEFSYPVIECGLFAACRGSLNIFF